MRILHIITGLSTGGAETMLQRLLMHPNTAQQTFEVVSLTEVGELGREIAASGVAVHALHLSRRNPLSILRLMKMVSILRSARPELVQTWMYHANLIGGLAARLFGSAPVVWNIRQDVSDVSWMRWSTWMVIRLGGLLARRIARSIVAVAQKTVGSHAKIGYPAEMFTVIPNGIDTERFAPDEAAKDEVRAELGLDEAARLIGYFARYHPMKDHRTLIEAAGLLHQRDPQVHFVLCGRGVEESNLALAAQIEAEGLEGCVHLLGLRKDVPRLLAALDLYAISSLSEGFPLAVAEAMSCGVPCVVTDVGDTLLLVGDTGVVVPPRDPGTLAGACLSLLDQPKQAYTEMRQAARQRIIDNFSLEEMVARYNELYREVVGDADP